MNKELHSGEHHVPFSHFVAAIAVQLTLALGVFRLLDAKEFLAEAHHPAGIVLWTVLLGLPISLFEYLYHRYLLHSSVLPFLGAMHSAHSKHHSLTSVKAPVTPREPARLVEVKSDYPVEEQDQEESMMFPLWAVSAFYVVFLLLLGLPLKLITGSQPAVMAVLFSVTLYYCFYEIWHAILHLPFEKFWRPFMNRRGTRGVAKRMYGFHLMHHWRPTANLAIVGFWGIALWDHAFRTHHRPDRMPLDGAEVNYHDATLVKPRWPIALLDRWQAVLYKRSRAIERSLLALINRGRQ